MRELDRPPSDLAEYGRLQPYVVPGQYPEMEAAQPAVSPTHYLLVIWRQRWKIMAFVATCLLATYLVSARMTPIYEATAKIDVDRHINTTWWGPKPVKFQRAKMPIPSWPHRKKSSIGCCAASGGRALQFTAVGEPARPLGRREYPAEARRADYAQTIGRQSAASILTCWISPTARLIRSWRPMSPTLSLIRLCSTLSISR